MCCVDFVAPFPIPLERQTNDRVELVLEIAVTDAQILKRDAIQQWIVLGNPVVRAAVNLCDSIKCIGK